MTLDRIRGLIDSAVDSNPFESREEMMQKGFRVITAEEYIEIMKNNAHGRGNTGKICLWRKVHEDMDEAAAVGPAINANSDVILSSLSSSVGQLDTSASEAVTEAWPCASPTKSCRIRTTDLSTTSATGSTIMQEYNC